MIWVKRVGSILGAIAVLVGIIFGVNTYETQFATADDITQIRKSIALLEQRLEKKIQEDRLHAIQRRLWSLEDRYGGLAVPNAPREIRDSYRELSYEALMLKTRLGIPSTKGNFPWQP